MCFVLEIQAEGGGGGGSCASGNPGERGGGLKNDPILQEGGGGGFFSGITHCIKSQLSFITSEPIKAFSHTQLVAMPSRTTQPDLY